MTDEEALLRAVIADPDDDAPRLIYADWLDENGRGERAQFIRVQIALAGMSVHDERRPELRKVERRLLRRYGRTWAGLLQRPHWRARFHRGFVTILTCGADEFLRGDVDLLALAPIRALALFNVKPNMAELVQCPRLNRPLWLSLRESWIDDQDAFALAQSRFLGRLNGLDLASNRIGAAGAWHLARSPYLGSLDDLYLKGNPIPREARAELRRRFGSRVHF